MASQYFTVSFQTETTIYQKEYRCHVSENDFNYTTNPSAVYGTTKYANAKGTICINNNLPQHAIIDVSIDDPDLGMLSLGSYTVLSALQTTSQIASALQLVLATNSYGYIVTVVNSLITIEAREGLGASINGGTRIIVVVTYPDPVFDDTFDITFN